MTLDDINRLDADTFTVYLGGVYEHSPWVARQVSLQRPFASCEALQQAMARCVALASDAARLTLIRAHPQLAGKAAIRGELTPSSSAEQRGAGLDLCTPEEYAQITHLNDAYQAKFGFPFILAVRGHTRQSVIEQMQRRLAREPEDELTEALEQIDRIAQLRLADLVQP
ncbi:2-oxo-4-hydroxy-4-carboxy-5-ureidoimidazoline decarboxylase [Tahibacter amnicola]|uniref:2-oxo-4-hydroxy-4-carboxy-5-ureidoimidazoline decarboxylase n=1 Tax=Tahibacter amnicola TaxID=2976241 RepID=A0ABY6BFY8_9GAMM|nr:2-oxo-4-hydroxy-4-carboxy-5-ureidoimidazoline decarboxylase [Tahibacter amnicola]UXI68679.1 2-oxo-4-hydroxy-4-carboxy-5-ureidoimidazoline decarboxylase [Tahibacter amnicola]